MAQDNNFESMPHSIYEDGSSIDMVRLIKNVVNKLWLVLLAGVVFAAGGYILSESTYVRTYTAEATLAFMEYSYKKVTDYTETGEAETTVIRDKDFYGGSDVKRYQYLLTGSKMIKRIKDALDAQGLSTVYSEGFIKSSLNISTVSDDLTGFFVLSVTSEDSGYCERALEVVMKEFPDYIKSLRSSIDFDVIKDPTPPYVSSSANSVANALYGFVIGAAIVIIIVFFSVLVTDTIEDMDQLKSLTHTKVLGAIPIMEKPTGLFMKKKVPSGALLITDEKKVSFSFIESFKAIRTKLENVHAERGYKCFVITSTYEDEGKTTVSVNIACALAQKGKSVLLIDCDFRKPAVLRAVGVKSDTRYGLIPIIKGTSTYVDSVKFIKSLGIFVLPTGGVSLKSTEVLDAEKVRNILEQARKEFDYIIIDSPPAHVVTDSLVIAPLTDGIIYCVRRDYAKTNEVNRTLDEIRGSGIEIIGTILTLSSGEENNRYYKKKGYYRRSGRYGYGKKKGRYGGYGGYGRYGGYGQYGNYGGYGGYGGFGGYGYSTGYGYGSSYGGYGYGGNGGYGYGNYSGYGYGYGGRNAIDSSNLIIEKDNVDNNNKQ